MAAQRKKAMQERDGIIHVSTPLLFLSMTPLIVLALVSSYMALDLEKSILVGSVRVFVQLSILASILRPIFRWGVNLFWIVIVYVGFMVWLAAHESVRRSKYRFDGMLSCALGAFLVNIGLVSVFAFRIILRPTPAWNPRYVIPIVGMLLGNCINGAALAFDTMLSSLVEQSQEVEFNLAFGASTEEATSRLTREAVRVGALPILNSMAVIGLISIPGMMTGQILGGARIMDAARYQILICYLIAICAFGTIFSNVWIARTMAFDSSQMLCVDRFQIRQHSDGLLFFGQVSALLGLSSTKLIGEGSTYNVDQNSMLGDALAPNYDDPHESLLNVTTLCQGSSHYAPNLEVRGVSRSIKMNNGRQRTLFRGISIPLYPGGIVSVRGPSGVGKSQLMRLLAGLSPADKGGDLLLQGHSFSSLKDTSEWRRRVRYVSQYKIDLPGTPRHFVERVASFRSFSAPSSSTWQGGGEDEEDQDNVPSFQVMLGTCIDLITRWNLDADRVLDQEWKHLSGGEAQRVHIAAAIASRPRVLLLDESTSALDPETKLLVERSVVRAILRNEMSVVWISHDPQQLDRLAMTSSKNLPGVCSDD